MVSFNDDDILKLDERLAQKGIPFHARPFHAAKEILGEQFVMGVGGNSKIREIERAYARLIPEVEFTWPGMGTGLEPISVGIISADKAPITNMTGVGNGTGNER